jgi:hypothetical protein
MNPPLPSYPPIDPANSRLSVGDPEYQPPDPPAPAYPDPTEPHEPPEPELPPPDPPPNPDRSPPRARSSALSFLSTY